MLAGLSHSVSVCVVGGEKDCNAEKRAVNCQGAFQMTAFHLFVVSWCHLGFPPLSSVIRQETLGKRTHLMIAAKRVIEQSLI
jgi:hypothetical protein